MSDALPAVYLSPRRPRAVRYLAGIAVDGASCIQQRLDVVPVVALYAGLEGVHVLLRHRPPRASLLP